MTTPSTADRCRGALLGLAWGETLGLSVPGCSPDRTAHRHRAGPDSPAPDPANANGHEHATPRPQPRPRRLHAGHTQHALALLAVSLPRQRWSTRRWADCLVAGAATGTWRHTSAAVDAAIAALRRGTDPQASGHPTLDLAPAGRTGPLGAAIRDEPRLLAHIAFASSLVTHADLRAASLAYAVAETVRLAVTDTPAPSIRHHLPAHTDAAEQLMLCHASDWNLDSHTAGVIPDLLQTLTEPARRDAVPHQRLAQAAHRRLADEPPATTPNPIPAVVDGLDGLATGLLASDPTQHLTTLTSRGTASVAAIAGTILGARFGPGWLPTSHLTDTDRLHRWAATLPAAQPAESPHNFLARETELAQQQAALT